MRELTDVDVQRGLAMLPKRFISARVFAPTQDMLQFEDNSLRMQYGVDLHGAGSGYGQHVSLYKTLRNAMTKPDIYGPVDPPPSSKRVVLLLDLTRLPIVEVDDGARYANDTVDDELQLAERQAEMWWQHAARIRARPA